MRGFLLLAACVASLPAFANEGMWTFDNFPATAVRQGSEPISRLLGWITCASRRFD